MRIKEAEGMKKIKQAYVNAAPDICDVILSDCEKEKGKVILMTEEKKKRGGIKYFMAAAGVLAAVGAGSFFANLYHINYAVASTVSLEVNPSVQITVNEKERVLDVNALNRDGEIVVGDMDFSGSDIDVTVNALIGSMLRNGYLNELANSVLISVDNADPAKGEILQEKLTAEVNELLESGGFFGAVLGQTITGDSELQQQAKKYDITLGKAQLIQQILDSKEGHTFEELAPLSIHELNLIIASGTPEIQKVSSLGNASDKAYIGEEKAKEIAFAHAGAQAQDVTFYEMDMDVEKGVMVYEIEFKWGGFEYEYDIDAKTGEIVKNKKETDDDMPAGTGLPSAGTTSPSAGTATTPDTTVPPSSDGTIPPSGSAGGYQHTEHHEDYNHGMSGSQQGGAAGSGAASGNQAQGFITADAAKETALNHAGVSANSVYFEKVELDYENGISVYEIEFVGNQAEYEYEIDAASGAILKYDWDIEQTAGSAAAAVTLEQAKEIALNHAGVSASSVYLKKAELDHDDGRQIYEIEFVNGNMEYEYEIDAASGAIIDYDWDYD